MSNSKQESAASIGSAIFESSDSFATEFMDKVRTIHEHFDKDNDDHLNFDELASLQLFTSGAVMDSNQYGMVCQALGCRPSQGLSLDAMKLTYAADGANIDEDYKKVFEQQRQEKDGVIEVGEGGVDISPDS